jgi:hypothetical protein
MHTLSTDTIDTLRGARNGSLKGTAVGLGFNESFAGTISAVLNGKRGQVSMETENKLRLALGLTVLYTVEVPSCTDCGSVHHARCHGNHGDVVVLGAAKPNRPQSPNAKRRKALRAACKKRGVTLEDAAEMWLKGQRGR